MKILHVISEVDRHGPAGQLALLGREMPDTDFETRVCVLGQETPAVESLRAAGLAVDVLGRRRLFPLATWWRLHHVFRTQRPDIIHAWDSASLRAVTMAGGRSVARVIAKSPNLTERPNLRDRFDRWLTRRSHRIVAGNQTEKAQCLAHGFGPECLALVPPGIGSKEARYALGQLPAEVTEPGARWVVCAGRLHIHQGFQTALWAFDILCFIYDNVHLLVLGDGPDRALAEKFGRMLRGGRQVHILGERHDAADLFTRADVVWALTPLDGAQVALEGMAAGRPIIATQHPALAEIVTPATGILVPANEPVILARSTRDLLEDTARARRLGEAGQLRVRSDFPARRFAQGLIQLYLETAA